MASEFARSVALGCWNASATGDQRAALAALIVAIDAAVRKRCGRWAAANDNCEEEKYLAQIEFIMACDAACKAAREAALKKEGKRGK